MKHPEKVGVLDDGVPSFNVDKSGWRTAAAMKVAEKEAELRTFVDIASAAAEAGDSEVAGDAAAEVDHTGVREAGSGGGSSKNKVKKAAKKKYRLPSTSSSPRRGRRHGRSHR